MKHLIVKSKEFHRIEIAFKEWLKVLGYSDNIVETLPSNIREFFHSLEKKDGISKLKQITSENIVNYYNRLSNRKNNRRGGSLSTPHLKKHLYALKLFSVYLLKTQHISLTIDIKGEKVERRIKHILTKKEINKLLDSIKYDSVGLRDRAMIGVYYGCGLRLNEGINLELDDILLNKRLIYVREGKNYQERYVPMNEKVMIYLRDYINYGRMSLLKAKENNLNNKYLFITYRGNKVQGQSFYKRLKVLQKRTNDSELMKKDIGIHTLRHSIATHLLQQGMTLESIKDFLGHKSIESTQIYTHLTNENL